MTIYDDIVKTIYKSREATSLSESLSFMRIINSKTLESLRSLTDNELMNIAMMARLFITQPRADELRARQRR